MLNGELGYLLNITVAVILGGVIGLERSFHGRPAGFRTHTLVCLCSAVLMSMSLHQNEWFVGLSPDAIRADPTRMAQGIMTGIGFLGAGAIFKEGLTVRGLTTAASIWITAAIGILVGAGLYLSATAAALITVSVLSLFRWIESVMPTDNFAHFLVQVDRARPITEEALIDLVRGNGCEPFNICYRSTVQGTACEFTMVLKTKDRANLKRLAEELFKRADIRKFRLAPTGD